MPVKELKYEVEIWSCAKVKLSLEFVSKQKFFQALKTKRTTPSWNQPDQSVDCWISNPQVNQGKDLAMIQKSKIGVGISGKEELISQSPLSQALVAALMYYGP